MQPQLPLTQAWPLALDAQLQPHEPQLVAVLSGAQAPGEPQQPWPVGQSGWQTPGWVGTQAPLQRA